MVYQFHQLFTKPTINTSRLRQDGRHFADDIFTCIFFNENFCILIKFLLKYVCKGPIENNLALVQIMAWRRSGDKPSSEPMMISLLTHLCVTRPQWVNIEMVLTHWGRDKMAANFQTPFSIALSWKKMFEFRLKFHWRLFLRVQLTIFQHWFRKWLGAVQAPSHYLNQWWLDYRHIYASLGLNQLTHWGRVMHKCIVNLTIIGSDNGLSPAGCQAIFWINAGILLTGQTSVKF